MWTSLLKLQLLWVAQNLGDPTTCPVGPVGRALALGILEDTTDTSDATCQLQMAAGVVNSGQSSEWHLLQNVGELFNHFRVDDGKPTTLVGSFEFSMGVIGHVLTMLVYSGVIVALIYLIIIGLPARAPRDPAVDDGPTTNLLIFMCLVYALVHVTSDQYIPNLPKMGRVLHGSQFVMSGSLQYTILLKGLVGLMAAWCSDRVGRRPMLLAATLLMMVTCIMCGCATRVEWFLASRLLQGVAESVEPVIVAMARDYASEAKQRLKLIGILECMDFVGCSISPVFGAWIASRYNWRMPFFILSVAWAFLSFYGFTQLRESAPEANHKTAPNLSRILGNPSLRWLLLTESCILGAYFVMDTNNSYLLENTFGCSPLATALVILGYGLLAAFGAVMSPHFFTGTIMACAKTTCQFFTLMGLISFMLGVFAPGLPGYVGGVYLQAISMMMAYTSVNVLYFETLEDCAGLAAACEILIQMVFSGTIFVISTYVLVDEGVQTFILFQAAICVIAGVMFWLGRPFPHIIDREKSPETSPVTRENSPVSHSLHSSSCSTPPP
ncbi:Multidrug resistance protein MdtL [Durusdinium trenchii]|uniref:Multidrug resistance protein MdtL n=1 Tax=Durusdinium trenchii TaxID=1381693 RepID=A0ABP0HVX6_9DINO